MALTSSDTNIDLVINQLTEEQYIKLSSDGLIDDNQLYLVPDDSDYYEKSETSSAIEIQEAFDNIPIAELSGQVNPIKNDVTPQSGYYRVYSDKMNNLASVSDHMKIILDNYDFSKSYVMKFNTPENSEIHFDFYIDNGSGPQFDPEMNINKSYSFPMNSGYVIEVKFDAMDIRPLVWTGERQKMVFRTIEWVED